MTAYFSPRFYGTGSVVTGNSGRDVIYDGAVAIDEDKILSVGPSSEIEAAHAEAATIDGRGKAIFPGLINCHTHLEPILKSNN